LRKANRRTTLDQVLDWITRLHGYLSAPKGGGIRHVAHLKAGISTQAHEARLFCNLIRSYITYLIAEHERLTGHRNVLEWLTSDFYALQFPRAILQVCSKLAPPP
jgi:hypothetical protein